MRIYLTFEPPAPTGLLLQYFDFVSRIKQLLFSNLVIAFDNDKLCVMKTHFFKTQTTELNLKTDLKTILQSVSMIMNVCALRRRG